MGLRKLFDDSFPNDRGTGDKEENSLYFAAHHTLPVTYGDATHTLPESLLAVDLDRRAVEKPSTRGIPPVWYVPLPSPRALRLVSPYLPEAELLDEEQPPLRFPSAPVPRSRAVSAPVTQPAGTAAAASLEATYPRPAILEQFDPVFAYLVYLALGLGTLFLNDTAVRFVILAFTLIIIGGILTLLDSHQRLSRITTPNLLWGGGVGLLIGMPLLILVGSGLAATTNTLYAGVSTAALFQLVVLTMPVGETLFFRGILQDERGFLTSIVAVGLGSLMLFWPTAAQTPVYLGVGAVFSTGLAAVYSYIRTRYGLAAAAICQSTLNLLLIFIPSLLI